jgi:hypothetical protein
LPAPVPARPRYFFGCGFINSVSARDEQDARGDEGGLVVN